MFVCVGNICCVLVVHVLKCFGALIVCGKSCYDELLLWHYVCAFRDGVEVYPSLAKLAELKGYVLRVVTLFLVKVCGFT